MWMSDLWIDSSKVCPCRVWSNCRKWWNSLGQQMDKNKVTTSFSCIRVKKYYIFTQYIFLWKRLFSDFIISFIKKTKDKKTNLPWNRICSYRLTFQCHWVKTAATRHWVIGEPVLWAVWSHQATWDQQRQEENETHNGKELANSSVHLPALM